MYEKIISGLLLVIAAIHLMPTVAVLGVENLRDLYGVSLEDNNLEILMRHRALLFGLLGGIFVYAAFKPTFQPLAFTLAFFSVASFFYLSYSVGDFNNAIRKVVIADVIASIALLISISLYALKEMRN